MKILDNINFMYVYKLLLTDNSQVRLGNSDLFYSIQRLSSFLVLQLVNLIFREGLKVINYFTELCSFPKHRLNLCFLLGKSIYIILLDLRVGQERNKINDKSSKQGALWNVIGDRQIDR